MGYRDHWWGYEPTRAIPVKDGIKARSRRGPIGESWWSRRWIGFLESLHMGARLDRGRSYARRGQVVSMDIEQGAVNARVQGSQPTPYTVTIRLAPLSEDQWDRVIGAMAAQALFSAKLLSGEMPQNIEEAFQAAQVSLFPTTPKDLQSDCSCPDWANPCKHVAAVFLLLGEEFDRDPFLVFLLRGQEKADLIARLRESRASSAESEPAGPMIPRKPRKGREKGPAPLEKCLDRFWAMGQEMASFRVNMAPPAVPLGVLKRLGPPPFVEGKGRVTDALGEAYRAVSAEALKLAYGEAEDRGGN
ncbi:MAG: SWIM zinc finger family protein [Chloroflexi bacterium]|nr:SWIM zinc finger family protein [Chloroflexota bacterium]